MTCTVMLAVTDTNPGNRLAILSHCQTDAARGDELERNLTQFLSAGLRGGSANRP